MIKHHVILAVALLAISKVAYSEYASLSNIHLPLDQNGTPLYTGEASTLHHNNTFYLYMNDWGSCPGVNCCKSSGGCASCCFSSFKNYTHGCSNPSNGSSPYGDYHKIWVYKTDDFAHWTNLGVALPLSNRPAGVMFRPHVVYNQHTHKFIMWYENKGPNADRFYAVATSDSPSGPFVTANPTVVLPGKGRVGDYDIFVDDDGSAYHIRTGFDLVKLNAEYTGVDNTTEAVSLPFTDGEAPTMFKRKDVYYITTGSACCGCMGGSNVVMHYSKDILGSWRSDPGIGVVPGHKIDPHSPHNYVSKAQASDVFQVGDQFVYLANQWNSGLSRTPPGPRNHDLLYWHVFQWTPAANSTDVDHARQLVWKDEESLQLRETSN